MQDLDFSLICGFSVSGFWLTYHSTYMLLLTSSSLNCQKWRGVSIIRQNMLSHAVFQIFFRDFYFWLCLTLVLYKVPFQISLFIWIKLDKLRIVYRFSSFWGGTEMCAEQVLRQIQVKKFGQKQSRTDVKTLNYFEIDLLNSIFPPIFSLSELAFFVTV